MADDQTSLLTTQFIEGMTKQALVEPVDFDSEMYKYFNVLIATQDIPQAMRTKFWAFTDKEAVLTNVDPPEIKRILLDFDINYLMFLMSQSEEKFTFEEMSQIEQAKAHLNIRLHRAIGGFERRMESTQIRELNVHKPGGPGENVLGAFFGLFKKQEKM